MMTTTITTTLDSPIGVLTLTASAGRLTGVFMDGQRHVPQPVSERFRNEAWFADIADQLDAYFSGDLLAFDVPLQLEGTEFQRRVWSHLRQIPYGETISYGELARRVGSPGAARACGLANGRNPVSVIVPCHRVIGADGRLTGYGGGLERKAWLLGLESAHRPVAV
jgi:methylated-DNA-[protein]-cysteine S-methyltransferase